MGTRSQKGRGGYYTPPPIARFLAKWAIKSSDAVTLEPSCGDGEILEAVVRVLKDYGANNSLIGRLVRGIEVDTAEAEKATRRLDTLGVQNGQVIRTDFFSYCKDSLIENEGVEEPFSKRFDAVIGNPPFIRYQDFPEEPRLRAFELMNLAGFHPTRMMNIWVPFLVISAHLLKDDGRLAMVLPAELFQVNYAAETRKFLSKFFPSLTIITFNQLVFEGILQEVVLLLGERRQNSFAGIRTVELDNVSDLESYQHGENSSVPEKPLDHSSEKWTQYFLTNEEIQLLRTYTRHSLITPSKKVIGVEVGIVTGNNKFFVLSEDEAMQWNFNGSVRNIVTRSAHLKGLRFTDEDRQANQAQQHPALMFYPPELPVEQQSPSVQDFIRKGEELGVHEGYKCRKRKTWYRVPSVWKPDAFMLRQVHAYPKLILNESEATCTDTIHRVRFLNGRNSAHIVAAFMNSLTFAASEVKGRSYGGGVLTFEPREAEDLPLPLSGSEKLDLKELDYLLRNSKIETVLDVTDRLLLIEGLGMSRTDVKRVRGIWEKLRDRRIRRK